MPPEKATGETDPNKALRYNTGKAQMHQVPRCLITGTADVLTYGEKKYAKYNWRKGGDYSTSYDCLMRHITSWFEGEENDPESGLSHLKHAAANIAFLLYYVEHGVGTDDRPESCQPLPSFPPSIIDDIAETATATDVGLLRGLRPTPKARPIIRRHPQVMDQFRENARRVAARAKAGESPLNVPKLATPSPDLKWAGEEQAAKMEELIPDLKRSEDNTSLPYAKAMKAKKVAEVPKEMARKVPELFPEHVEKSKALKELEAQVENLKKVNAELLAQTSMGQHEASLRTMIADVRKHFSGSPVEAADYPKSEILEKLPEILKEAYAEAIGHPVEKDE